MADVLSWVDSIWRRGLAPEPQITVSEWAEAHRILPETAAEPGPWRNGRTPYLCEIMNCLSVSSVIERVVFMKGAQLGATEAGLNWTGYVIANAPGLMLHVMPSLEAMRRTVRTRIDPLIADCPVLTERVVKAKSRDPGNSQSLKSFPGGQDVFTGANSAVGLRSTPARYLFLDEVDGFPSDADGEGDPVALAVQRSVTFRGRRKIFLVSTPTISGISRIEKAYLESDQRKFFVPCPACGAFQVLAWAQVHWPGDDRTRAFYTCEACQEPIHERQKMKMILGGVWRATAPGDGLTAGFHLSALYSPFETWAEIAVEHGKVYRDPPRLQAWVNLKLGEAWEDRQSVLPEPARLMARSEAWGERLPEPVVVVTAGVDVQLDRVEVEIVGWGRGEESWSLEYQVISGNPVASDMWLKLDALLMKRHAHPRLADGLSVAATCVDTGAYSKAVYDYATPRHGRRVWAIKGSSIKGAPIWPRRPSRPKPGRPPLYIIGPDAAKEIVVARLSIEEPGAGMMHFPTGRDLSWFKMLTAERPIRRFVKGVAVREWVKAAHARNEALDARVYSMAALHGLKATGFSLDREAERVAGLPPCVPRGAETPAVKPRSNAFRSKWMER